MIEIQLRNVRRLSLASKLFPSLRSTIGLDTSKLRAAGTYDGELFCGGRSKNRDLLTYFGFIAEPNGSSTFLQLPLLRRSLRKLTNLVEQELEVIGAQEILLPTLVPQSLWVKSKRLERQGEALKNVYTFTDNGGNELLLGPTFEESITNLVAHSENVFENQLPLLLYQTSSKFRFEPNPRFGLLRTNEFIMNDLYSFDADVDRAQDTYKKVANVYNNLFNRLGLECVRTDSLTGSIGGRFSHEYQLVVPSGEDTILHCKDCGHHYNSEMRGAANDLVNCLKCGGSSLTELKALELGHTFLLADTYSKPLRAMYTKSSGKEKLDLQMGCYGLGLTRIIGAGVDLLSVVPTSQNSSDIVQIRWPTGLEPFTVGIVTPARRSENFHRGSTEFARMFLTKTLEATSNIDIIVEDRDKHGISKRIISLKNLGIPYIIVIGQKFLADPPEFELLRLNRSSGTYEQDWLTEDRLIEFLLNLDQKM